MATLTVNSSTQTTINATGGHNGTVTINQYRFFRDGVGDGAVTGITPTTSISGITHQYSGLSAGTTYGLSFVVFNNGTQVSSSGTVFGSTQAAPQPPVGTPSVSASRGNRASNVSWSSVSGTGVVYDVLANGVLKVSGTTATFASISLDREYELYTITVTPRNAAGTGSSGSTSVRTLDVTSPTVSILSSSATTTSITLNTSSGSDPLPFNGNASGIQASRTYFRDGTPVITTTATSFTYSGLSAGSSYSLTVLVSDNDGNQGSASGTFSTNAAPPSVAPSVSVTRKNRSFDVSWTSVAGATGYKIYTNDQVGSGDVLRLNISGTLSATINVEAEYSPPYVVKVRGFNSGGDGPLGVTAATRTLDVTLPTVSIVNATNITPTEITLNVSPNDPAPTAPGAASGVRNRSWFRDGLALTSTTTNSFTFTGLTGNRSYTLGCIVDDFDGNNSAIAQATYTTPPSDVTPPTITSFTVDSTTQTSIVVSMTASDASGIFRLNFSRSVGSSSTPSPTDTNAEIIQRDGVTSATVTFSGLTPGFYYTISGQAIDNAQLSTIQTISNVRTVIPDQAGAVTNATATGSTSFTWFISGLSQAFNTANYQNVGIFGQPFTTDSPTQPAALIQTIVAPASGASTTTPTATSTGAVSAGTTYTLYGGAQAANGRWYTAGSATISTRPTNFAWTTPKVAITGDFNVTATEWSGFTSTINGFRAYKKLANAVFTPAATGNDFTAVIFNEARTAINDLTPPTAVPILGVKGNDVLASQLNGLRDSLNSVT